MPDQLIAKANLGSILDPVGRESDIAVIDEAGDHSYGAVDAAANNVAAAIASRGLGRGDRIGIFGENSVDFIAVLFGIMRAGCTAVPISPKLSPAGVAALIERANVRLVYADAKLSHRLPQSPSCLALAFKDHDAVGSTFKAVVANAEDVAKIIFTSGSTGRARGVALTHGGQLWFLNTLLNATGWTKETAIVAAPLYHSNALIRVMCAFACGGTLVLLPQFNADHHLAAIQKHKVTLLTGVPAMYFMLLARRELLASTDLSSVRRIMIGSAAAPDLLVDRLAAVFPGARIGVAYGLTEAGGTVCSTLFRPDDKAPPRGSVGRMLPGIEALFGGDDEREGELYLRSPAISPGYDAEPEQNVVRFAGGWLRTGDVLRRDSDGYYYFRGRTDDMFVVGGENVYPAEVEALVSSHPSVRQSAVVPIPHDTKGEVPCAFVVPYADKPTTSDSIKDHALRGGAPYLHPRKIIFVDALPLTGTGKVDYAALRQSALQSLR